MDNEAYGVTDDANGDKPNAFGLYDRHGNAWQWVEDCWHKDYIGAPVDGSAWNSGDCITRVVRGGSWNDRLWDLRAAHRSGSSTEGRYSDGSLRVARTLSP
jgi:formylglycine-generating enzyme required for sulfatase activity